MLDTIKRHLISAAVTFLSTVALSVVAAWSQLDPWVTWKTYLEAWSLVGFLLALSRAFFKIFLESLVPALKNTIPTLIILFQSFLEWSKNLITNNK